MQKELKIVCIQSDIIWENPEANIQKYTELIRSTSFNTDLIVLPEMFATGFSMKPVNCAESMEGSSISWMKEIAQNKQVAIMGTLAIVEDKKYYNRFVFVHPNGELKFMNKRHLFSYGGEDKVYTAGNNRLIVEYLGWKICPMICYDLRFPIWSRNDVDYDLLVYMANWPKPRTKAWDTLLKARSIENMCYTIGVNRIGLDGSKLEYIGHTQVVDMLGNMTANSIERKEMIIETTLDKNLLIETRKKFQFLNDRDSFELV